MSRRPEARAIPSPPTVATVEAPTRAAPGGQRRGSPSVAVVGGGFGGIGAALILRRHGYQDFTVFERGERIGGVWSFNTRGGPARAHRGAARRLHVGLDLAPPGRTAATTARSARRRTRGGGRGRRA